MKILQTIKYYEPSKGGMESVAKNLANGIKIVRRNYNLKVVCNNHLISTKNIKEQLNSIDIFRYKSFFYKSQPISFRFKGLSKHLKDADVIHHHYPFPTMELALLRNLNILKSKIFVITWHANIQNSRWKWIEKFYNPLIKKLLKVSHTIVVTSPQLLENSTILQDFKHKVKVIPIGFDQSNHFIEKKVLLPIPKLLFVGKLREYKGLKFLIESIKDLNIHLDIVGNGELENSLNKLIQEYHLENKIKIHNRVSDEELEEFYKQANIFVLPSINEAEAFGVVQLEALSYGLPVVNTNLKSGVPFVSLDGLTGFTVEPKNTIALKNAIEKIISSDNLYSEFSLNAYKRAKEFSNKKMVEKYLDIYENIYNR